MLLFPNVEKSRFVSLFSLLILSPKCLLKEGSHFCSRSLRIKHGFYYKSVKHRRISFRKMKVYSSTLQVNKKLSMKLKWRILTMLFMSAVLASFLGLVFVELLEKKLHRSEVFTINRQTREPVKIPVNLYETIPILVEMDSDKAEEESLIANNDTLLKVQRFHYDRRNSYRKTTQPHSFHKQNCAEVIRLDVMKSVDGNYKDLVAILFSTRIKKTREENLSIQDILGIQQPDNLTSVEQFYLSIREKEMYGEADETVDKVLRDMSNMPITHIAEKQGGTQLKLLITFDDGSQALMKPMRFGRNKETDPNHFYFVDFERHVSEIAAFHLDRILGFRRTPPVVGRLLNITSEIYATADDELLKTFFISPANNICFHGSCSYYCDTGHAICGRSDILEGSLAMFLPPNSLSNRKSWRNPWRRSYHKRKKAPWEQDDLYCDFVRATSPYDLPHRLLDVVDMSVLDFLIDNMDRHHYETFQVFGNDSFVMHLDHGRGFGRSNHDEVTILAPLYQCCFLRRTTFKRLLDLYYTPGGLSGVMRCSLHGDPLDPVLNEKHLKALDRRLVFILEVINDCLKRTSVKSFLYLD